MLWYTISKWPFWSVKIKRASRKKSILTNCAVFRRPSEHFDSLFFLLYTVGDTDASSSHHGGYRTTDKAFIYSLSNKEGLRPFKSKVKNPSQAIYMNPSYGPTFGGGHDIYIADKANGNINSYAQIGFSYNRPSGVKDQKTILAGSFRFTPGEVEVFYLF